MNKKIYILLMTMSISVFSETKENLKEKLFTDKDRIELDKLQSAQEQLNLLTKDAPFWTSPTKGVATLAVGAVMIAASQTLDVNHKNEQAVIYSIAATLMCVGGIHTIISTVDNRMEREYYKNIIYDMEKNQKILSDKSN